MPCCQFLTISFTPGNFEKDVRRAFWNPDPILDQIKYYVIFPTLFQTWTAVFEETNGKQQQQKHSQL